MWVFDGEEWKEEGGSGEAKPETVAVPFDKMVMPELQIVEVVPVPAPKRVPPFPLP